MMPEILNEGKAVGVSKGGSRLLAVVRIRCSVRNTEYTEEHVGSPSGTSHHCYRPGLSHKGGMR